MKPFKKGERVEIVGNTPFPLNKLPGPHFGRVEKVDGAYITVRPHYRRWLAEFLPRRIETN